MFTIKNLSPLGFALAIGVAALSPDGIHAQTCTEPAGSLFATDTLVPNGGDVADLSGGNQGPVGIAVSQDEKVFVAKMKTGEIRVYLPGVSNKNTVLVGTIPTYFNTEDGLLGIALDRNFLSNRWIYAFYSDPATSGANRGMELARFTYDPTKSPNAQLTLKKVLLRFARDSDTHHAAGGISVDASNTLIFGTGDNSAPTTGNANAGYAPIHWPTPTIDAQKSSGNSNDLRGKIVRIRPLPFADSLTPTPGIGSTYEIPAGNLWEKVSDPVFNPQWNAAMDTLAKVRKEIFSMGHRNPYHVRVDNKSGWIFWGEIGPDAANNSATQGPMGHEEWNLATGPGFFGHPYCNGKNQPWNSKTNPATTFGTPYDCEATGSSSLTPMRNVSPNNSGIKNLPRAIPAVIAYANNDNTGTGAGTGDSRFGSGGGESAIGGGMYRYDPGLASTSKFPPYYEGKVLFWDWERPSGTSTGFKWLVLNPNGTLDNTTAAVRNFTPAGLPSGSYIDAEFGPKGDLYLLRYSNDGYTSQNTSGLYRVRYTGTYDNSCFLPFTATVGPGPVSVAGASHGIRKSIAALPVNGLVTLPVGYRSVALYNLSGRKVWSYNRATTNHSEAVKVPMELAKGILQVKLIP